MAIAGFAGIITAIGRPEREVERQQIRALVLGAVWLLVFSLLPMLLNAAPIGTSVWRIAAGGKVVFLALYYFGGRASFPLVRESPSLMVFVAGDVVMFVGLVAIAIGAAGAHASFVYLCALFWVLLQVLGLFIGAVSSLWQTSE